MTIKVNIQTILRTSSFWLRNGDVLYYLSIVVKSQTLAATNPAEVEKTIKSLGPLQVEYNGKVYEDGKTLKMNPESLEGIIQGQSDIPLSCGFFLKNGISGEAISWELKTSSGATLTLEAPLRISATSNSEYLGIKWPDGQAKLKLTATSGSRKVTLNLEKQVWNLSDLQVADGNRIAKAGEILYLVKAPAKDEKATVSWKSDVEPSLLKNYFYVDGKNPTGNFRSNKIIYNFSNSPNTTTYRMNALGYDKTVKVEVVDKYQREYKVVPFAISTVFENIKTIDRTIGTLLRKLGPVTGLVPSIKTEIGGTWQNNEVKTDRFVQDEKQVGASAKFGLSSPKDNPIPGLSYKIPYVGQIGGYWRFSTDISLGYNYITITKNNPAKTKSEKVEIPLKASGGLEVGAKVALLPDIETIKIEIKGYGKGAVYGLGRYTPSTKQFNYEVGIDAVVGGFSGTIKAGGFTVFDQKYEKLLLDKTKWLGGEYEIRQ